MTGTMWWCGHCAAGFWGGDGQCPRCGREAERVADIAAERDRLRRSLGGGSAGADAGLGPLVAVIGTLKAEAQRIEKAVGQLGRGGTR